MDRGGKLNSANESDCFVCSYIKLDGFNQMAQIDLDVNKYVQDFNVVGDVDWDETTVTIVDDKIAA